jgi:hypothetical protein
MPFATSFKLALIVVAAITATGCASIVSESRYPVSIQSNPPGASYEIIDQSGLRVMQGQTPAQVTLDAGAGYFDGEAYKVVFHKEGYASTTQALDSGIDGWYWGNILFGGLIGLLVIDPISGAMFSLPDHVSADLGSVTPSDA